VEKLVIELKRNNKQAWDKMIQQYSNMIYSLAFNYAGNKDDAADITQEVFIKIYNNIDKYSQENSFQHWILRITKNYCIDYWRKNKRHANKLEIEEHMAKSTDTPEDQLIGENHKQFFREKLNFLDADLRMMIVMRDIENHSYQDIADYFQVPLGTVKSRINRARIKLAKILMKEGINHGMSTN
jgi:RNA polymerase sigma-70 factor (ECF subfamily)